MLKYCLNVYDFETGEKIIQVICPGDQLFDTCNELKDLGLVKGYILDDKESEK